MLIHKREGFFFLKQFHLLNHTIILPFSCSYIRTRNSLRLQLIYVSFFFLGFDFCTVNNKGWHKTLINTKGKKEVPLNSFDQNMMRNADLGSEEYAALQLQQTAHQSSRKNWCDKSDMQTEVPVNTSLTKSRISSTETFSFPLQKHFKFVRQ